jgi:hypothetical protein
MGTHCIALHWSCMHACMQAQSDRKIGNFGMPRIQPGIHPGYTLRYPQIHSEIPPNTPLDTPPNTPWIHSRIHPGYGRRHTHIHEVTGGPGKNKYPQNGNTLWWLIVLCSQLLWKGSENKNKLQILMCISLTRQLLQSGFSHRLSVFMISV